MSLIKQTTSSPIDITSEYHAILERTLPDVGRAPLRGDVKVSGLTASESRALTLRFYAGYDAGNDRGELVFESSVVFAAGAAAEQRTRHLSFAVPDLAGNQAVALTLESDNANDTTVTVVAALALNVTDRVHEWFVDAGIGDDTNNDGRHELTPFATIGAAVTASADGDTIFIGPGTYDEAVDLDTANKGLTLRGAGIGKTVLSQNDVARTIQLEDNSSVFDLSAISTKAGDGQGLYAGFKDNLRVERVYAEGPYDGALFGSIGHITIRDLRAESPFDALVVSGDSCIIEDTVALSTAVGVSGHGMRIGVTGGVLINSQAITVRSGAAGGDLCGITITGSLVMRGCRFYAELEDNFQGLNNAVAVEVNSSGVVLLDGCTLGTANVEEGAEYDIKRSAGVAAVSNTLYDTAKTTGTIIQVPPGAEILADSDALEQRLTAARAAKLDNLDAPVSSRSSHDDPDPNGHIDAATSTRATPADVHVTVTPAYGRQSSRRVGGIIHLPEDSNETLAWHLADSDGVDVDLTGYTGLDLEVYAAAGELLFERTLANGGLVIDNLEHGRVTITFTPDNLATAGTCKYEFWGIQEGGLPTCLARGSLIIEPTFGPTP